jgi:hypothetical protein
MTLPSVSGTYFVTVPPRFSCTIRPFTVAYFTLIGIAIYYLS